MFSRDKLMGFMYTGDRIKGLWRYRLCAKGLRYRTVNKMLYKGATARRKFQSHVSRRVSCVISKTLGVYLGIFEVIAWIFSPYLVLGIIRALSAAFGDFPFRTVCT